MSIATRYHRVLEELQAECVRCGRDPREVCLVAVSKTVDVAGVEEAIAAGARDFGENRPEQLALKATAFPEVRWHFIGNIQSRRIPEIVQHASIIHSVFKESHLAKIDKAARACGKVQDILLEVNVSGEESKSGLAPDELAGMLAAADAFDAIRVCGLMTMAPRYDMETANRTFAGLQALRDARTQDAYPRHGSFALHELSMGMTDDWPFAIGHGATMVRVGRAIFSDDFE